MFHKEYRMLAFVPRWAVTPRVQQQSVAEHSFFVALYANQIADLMGLNMTTKYWIVGAALRDDALEAWTSDMPGPGKRAVVDEAKVKAYLDKMCKEVSDLGDYLLVRDNNELGAAIIKAADLIDQLFYLEAERLMGNRMIDAVFEHTTERFNKHLTYFSGEIANSIRQATWHQMGRLEREGARIPAMDHIPPNGGSKTQEGDVDWGSDMPRPGDVNNQVWPLDEDGA